MPRSAPRATQLHHLAIRVADVEKCAAFYQSVLGFAHEKTWHDEGGEIRSIWLEFSTGRLMVERCTTGERGASGWHLLALGISVAERAQWRNHLEASGTAITGESQHSIYFADPEGNPLALSHWPEVAASSNQPCTG